MVPPEVICLAAILYVCFPICQNKMASGEQGGFGSNLAPEQRVP